MKTLRYFLVGCMVVLFATVNAYAVIELDKDSNNATDVDKGGTNATTVGGALTNLGFSTFIKTFIGDGNATAARATIGANNATSVFSTGAVPVAKGGTGGTNATAARTNLGLPPGPIADTNSTQDFYNKTIYSGAITAAANATVIVSGTTTGNDYYLGSNNTRLMRFYEGANNTVSYVYFGNGNTNGSRTDYQGTLRLPTARTGLVKATSGVLSDAVVGTDYCGPMAKIDAGGNRTITAAQLKCSGINITNHGQNATQIVMALPTADVTDFYSGIVTVVDSNATKLVTVKALAPQYIRIVADNGTFRSTTQNGTIGTTAQLAGCQWALWLPYQNYWHAKVIAGKSDNCTLAVR